MSRHCRRRLLTRDFRTRDADHANSFADSAIASSGSKGLERPRQFAVAGINCATPCAPARLTADGSNRLSRQISRAKKLVGRSFCAAAAASALQRVSVDNGCDGALWRASVVPISSGSAARVCSVRPPRVSDHEPAKRYPATKQTASATRALALRTVSDLLAANCCEALPSWSAIVPNPPPLPS